MTVTCPRCASRSQTALNAGAPRVCPACGANFSPPPLGLGTVGGRGGAVDLPTPKRAASGYIGQLTAPQAAGVWEDAEFDPKLDAELPSVFNDLELGDMLDASLPTSEGPTAAMSRPIFLGLDLRDLPAPVGPRPRSPVSLRGNGSAAAIEPRAAVSAPRVPPVAAAASAPVANPPSGAESEPAPLPAPPMRSPLAELVEAMAAPALGVSELAAVGDGKSAGRGDGALVAGKRVSNSGLVVPVLGAPPAGKRVSNTAIALPAHAAPAAGKRVSNPAIVALEPPAAPAGKRVSNPAIVALEPPAPVAGKRVSNPAMVPLEAPAPAAGKRVSNPAMVVPELGAPPAGKRLSSSAIAVSESGGPSAGKRVSSPGMVVPELGAPPAGKRASAPGIVVPRELIARDTQPVQRRSSQPGLPMFNKPIHALFDASDTPPPSPGVKAADSTPQAILLPALPSDDSARPAAGDSSGGSVRSGPPAGSSTATAEPRPVRLGYLIAGLAVLAILLTVIIAHIAGSWHKHSSPAPGKSAPAKLPAAASSSEDPPPN